MTTRNSSGQIDLMHWLIRLIAYIIDAIIIFVVTTILGHHNSNNSCRSNSHRLRAFLRRTMANFWALWITLDTILHHLGRRLGRNNWKKTHGLRRATGKRRKNINWQIIHPQHKQNLRAFPISRLVDSRCNCWKRQAPKIDRPLGRNHRCPSKASIPN